MGKKEKAIIELMNAYVESQLNIMINETIKFVGSHCDNYEEIYQVSKYLVSYKSDRSKLVEEIKNAIQAQIIKIALNSKKID